VTPDLIVVCAAMPERMVPIADELETLARRWPAAIAGAGASATLASRLAVRHLAGDPVTAAQRVAVEG
jgi:MerR family transcriptional regulator, light-induced transcriptional regulator